MAHIVDNAKSGRSRCRTCGEGIAKGDLRFAQEVPSALGESGGTTYHHHHLECAAKKTPSELRMALETCPFPVPQRARIEHLIAENEPRQKPTNFPYAERAPTPRSHCGECHTMIAKGALRIALQRENEGLIPMVAVTPRYLHAACARAVLSGDAETVLARIRENSHGLTREDLDELSHALGPRREAPIATPSVHEEDLVLF